MKRVTISCLVGSCVYTREAEFIEIPIVGDRITVWKKVFKNKSKRHSNSGITMIVTQRTWDNRDGGIDLRCDSDFKPGTLTETDLKLFGFA